MENKSKKITTKPKMSQEEGKIAYNAMEDFWENNVTEIKCPRCGGNFIYTEVGNSTGVECENKCGVKSTSRGI
jgi:hypothetical protein